MPLLGSSLLSTDSLTETEVFSLFNLSQRIRELHGENPANSGKFVALMFFEPSTRTRASFEVAAYKLGMRVLAPDFGAGSSRVKGETLIDTFHTISAMKPDAIVVRSAEAPEFEKVLESSKIPVINGGSGALAHPTQALLDAQTIYEEMGSLQGQKVLIVGDIRHGRVAKSNIQLLKKLGAEVAVCGPDEFLQEDGLNRFEIEEGLRWATVAMALRIQLERHGNKEGSLSSEKYHELYGINEKRMKLLGENGILMHPGPINQGVELSAEVLHDPRCKVLKQVENGVYIRAAILAQILGIEI